MLASDLVIVGTGIRLASHCTPEARQCIEQADIVFAAADAATVDWLATLNYKTHSLQPLYGGGRSRLDTYEAMAERIVGAVREGKKTCAVFYGHPSVYVRPTHRAIELARAEGFSAKILPGISSEDCLLADLEVDPGNGGWQSYEATAFVSRPRRFDPTVPLVLWQIGVTGDTLMREFGTDQRKLKQLSGALLENYPATHEAILYEAATLPISSPRIEKVQLGKLHEARVSQLTTLYIPPVV